jgi:hypothetical protein
MAKMTKKTTAKKPQTSAKSGAKKTQTKGLTAKSKAKPAAKPKPKTATTRIKPEVVQAKLNPIKKAITKRPPSTPSIPENIINDVITNLSAVKADLDNYAAHREL